MEIVTREKFASSHQENYSLPEGLTIDEMLASVNWNPDLRPWTYVSVDGQEVPAQIWSQTRPKKDRRVLVALRPAGGGGGGGGGSGKQIMMAVAAIVIAVVAWYAAPIIVGALAGVGTTGAAAVWGGAAVALTQAGIAIAGTLALGALVKPGGLGRQALTNSGSGGVGPSESSTYGVTGAQNALSPYGVVPRVYGRHRVTPPFAAEPFVVSSGTSQTINLLLDFGYGPLLVEDIRIGTTPIGNFPTARWFLHANYRQGDPLYIYQNDQATSQVAAVLTESVDNIRVVPQAASAISLEFQFPGGLVEFNDQGTSFQRNEHITIFAMSEDGSTGWQPISNFYPYALFQGEGGTVGSGAAQIGSIGVFMWSRGTIGGLPRGFISGDPAVNQMQIGSTFTYGGASFTIKSVALNPYDNSQWVVELSDVPPDVAWVYTHTGFIPGEEGRAGTFYLPGSQGILGPLTVSFGPSPYDVEFHGQTRSPRTVTVVMQMPYENKWNILVRRSTPVSGAPTIANAIVWGTIRAGRWVLPIYPRAGRTILEVQVTASDQISGQVQNINALCTSILYDPRAGGWIPTRNAAWIYADILTGSANPRPIPWDKVDTAKLTEWANKNDAATVQGDVFSTCDMVVDFRSTIGELAQSVCSTGRAAPAVLDGQYSVFMENEDRVPVQMFTNRNATGFSASRAWVDFPHAIKARYLSENTWNREELMVYADGYNAQNASKFENMELLGITRPQQVWRFARYFMAAALLRRERMSIQTDVENLVCQRGDLVRIAHDRLLSNATARVREVDAGLLTMDAYIPSELGSVPFPIWPADAGGPTANPPGWAVANAGISGVTIGVTGKGQLADGTGYCDFRVTKAAAGGTANSIQIFTANNVYFNINSDDQIVNSADYEILGAENFYGSHVRLGNQPANSTNGTGLGTTFSANLPWPPVGVRTQQVFTAAPGGTLGLTNGLRLLVEFNWQPTTDYPATMDIRVFTPRHFNNNPRPNLLQRVDDVRQRLVPNAEAAGARLGVAASDGSNVFPTGWISQQWAGWTREVVRVAQVWDYWDVDIRLTAPAGTAGASIVWAFNQQMPVSEIILTRVQMRQVAIVGTAPTVSIRHTALTAAGGFIQNSFSGSLTISTAHESEVTFGPTNFSGVANAERYSSALWVVPAAGQPCDVTYRIRLPLVGDTTNPTTGLPAIPAVAALFGQLRTANGELIDSFPILARPGEDQVLVTQSIADRVSPGDVIALGGLETETSEWLVDKITPGPDFTANLEFIEYAPEVLDADKGAIPPYVPNDGSGILTDLPPVRNLMLSSTLYVYTTDGVPTHQNLLQWDPPAFQVAFYIVSRLYVVADPGVGVTPPYSSENVRLEITRVQRPEFVDTLDTRTLRREGTLIRYFVIPVSVTGRRGGEQSVERVFLPDTIAPPAVNFTTNVLSETTMLIWDRPNILDLGGYQIRFSDRTWGTADPLWENMVSVVDSVSPNLTSLTVHIQTGTYAIRAYDTSGNFGPPSYSVTKVDTLPNVDAVTRLTEGPAWAGTFDRTELVGNELRLKKDAFGNYFSEGWYYPTAAVAYPDSWLFRVRGAFSLYSFPVGDDPRGDWNAQIWVSIQKAAPKLNAPWFTPLTTAQPLAGGPGAYVPLGNVSQTDLVGRLINWAVRLTTRRIDLTPSVKSATLIVDHSERREFGNDLATGTGGKNVTFAQPFFAPPSVGVTLNDGAVGDRVVKSASTTALTVEVFNNAGVSVNRKIDWQAIGYGRGGI